MDLNELKRSLVTTAIRALALVVICCAAFTASAQTNPDPAGVAFFETKIKPILTNNCFKCHSATAEKLKGELYLDSHEGLTRGGELGQVITAGDPEKSLLIEAIGYQAELKMPPTGKLKPQEIADLTEWVKMGAPWGKTAGPKPPAKAAHNEKADELKARLSHWAWQPVKAIEPPAVKDAAWARTPIDRFILDKLEARGLKPAAAADKRVLIRRAYYDLLGLPPTPEEVEAFVKDNALDAYEKLIDRLLANPHYGEKWGRHWLDLVRFAETNSYERDNPKPNAWRYRDYVIRAFNSDKPYDRFLKEQLAGDELPDADSNPDALIATGFYRLGIWDDEPADREQHRYDQIDDIVTTVGNVMLGVTVDCARCHDHKIDPVPQKDYYKLVAFFQNVNEFRNGGPTDERELFASPEGKAKYEADKAERKIKADEANRKVNAIEREFAELYAKQKGEAVGRALDLDDVRYKFYRDSWDTLPDFSKLKPEDEGTLPQRLFDLSPRTRDEAFGFVFDAFLTVPNDGNYTFVLHSDDGTRILIDGKEVLNHDGIHDIAEQETAVVPLKKGRWPIRLEYFQRQGGLGLRISWSGPGVRRRFLTARDGGAPIDARVIQTLGEDILGKEKFKEYNRLRTERAEYSNPPKAERVLCVTERGPDAPDTFVLIRGSAHAQGDKVQPGFLSALGTPDPVIPKAEKGAKSSGRRTVLANWIASGENRQTARVMANRIWQYHFGRGIVRSSNDFGMKGELPTHPELLDWLAKEFVAKGWSMKSMHRLIMTSSAYRMSSAGDATALAKDPRNDLFWRFDMRRLTAEELRDSVLATNGTLNLDMFGPSVYPPIPKEVLQGQSMPGHGWNTSGEVDSARRSVYIHVKRSLRVPIIESFDGAETDKSCPVRFVTVQPTQALSMVNGSFMNAEAEKLAARVQKESKETRGQVALALKLVMQRPATDAEVTRGMKLIDELVKQEKVSPEEAMKYFCLVALNLNEFVYLD